MSFIRTVLAGLLAACATVSFQQAGIGADSGQGLKLAEPSNRFGITVFNGLLGSAGKTVIMSPYSLGATLDMLTLGAEGQTAVLLKERGGQPAQSSEEQLELHRKLAVPSPGNVTLRLANSVWLRPNAEPLPAFVAEAQGAFNAQVKNIDFSQPQASGEEINGWVKGATQGVIPTVVDTIDPLTEFMLINTTYFKGQWAEGFDAAQTGPAPFTLADGSAHDVPMMHAVHRLNYAEGPLWHAVTIPYSGNRFQMFLITSKDPAKSTELRTEFGNKAFITALEKSGWRSREVVLSLPRFRAEFGTDLTPVLSQLGLSAAFGPNAQYPKITKEPLRATTVLQRAAIEVTEEGTEAAAATTVIGTRSIEKSVTFAADHPFFFGIVDTITGAVLFIGHVVDPVV